jgi:hypothetical protein
VHRLEPRFRPTRSLLDEHMSNEYVTNLHRVSDGNQTLPAMISGLLCLTCPRTRPQSFVPMEERTAASDSGGMSDLGRTG